MRRGFVDIKPMTANAKVVAVMESTQPIITAPDRVGCDDDGNI